MLYILIMVPKIRFISLIPDDFEPEGALEDCFAFYPNFQEDFYLLARLGYLMIESPETCKWLKSKTSLAEYLYWANGKKDNDIIHPYVQGGFWAPAEKAFGLKRHTLRKLAGKNGNECKPDISKDFLELKPHLEELRKQQKTTRFERRLFQHIKNLILLEAKEDDPESIHGVLVKILMLLTSQNTDKKITKPLLKKPFDYSL